MTINVDTVLITLALSALFLFFFIRTARKASAGVPGKFQAAIEGIVIFVDGLVRETFHGSSKLIAPLAITIFGMVFLMNFIDMIPVDWPPAVATAAGVPYLRAVPDRRPQHHGRPGLMVFLLIRVFGIRHKGFGTFVKEAFTRPSTPTAGRQGPAGGAQPAAARDRRTGAPAFAQPATVRQHVCRRADLHPDRIDDPGRCLEQRHDLRDGADAIRRRLRLDRVPHPGHHPAGLHLHDADHRLSQHGREPLFPFSTHSVLHIHISKSAARRATMGNAALSPK